MWETEDCVAGYNNLKISGWFFHVQKLRQDLVDTFEDQKASRQQTFLITLISDKTAIFLKICDFVSFDQVQCVCGEAIGEESVIMLGQACSKNKSAEKCNFTVSENRLYGNACCLNRLWNFRVPIKP